MKKIWWSMLIGVLLLGGCSTNAASHSRKPSSKESRSSVVTKKTNKVSSQVSESSSSEKKVVAQSKPVSTTIWNKTKEQKLAKFMQTWQSEMGQTYKGTYNGEKPNHLGYVFPDVIKNGQLDGKVKWGSRKINLTWSTNGENGNEFQIVAVATGGKPGTNFPTSYLFCIHNKRPVVLMTQTTNGNTLEVQDTQNGDLQAGFAGIVTGTRPAVLTDASLNTDVSSSVKVSPQRWPNAYQGTWYYYDTSDKKVDSQPESKISDVKLTYLKIQNIKWLDVRGAHQTAGDGTYEYVRYHYYDGCQIPVMMTAGGAGAWFTLNAYPNKAVAMQLQDFKYGDESKSEED
ncbi:DUF4767 domain-containing protein [Pediococcus damnosus]|uniref:DUF4767 domain-containing protein n=1 Tax=Pediococcus damnosus TaxID=51663 RepID=UPI000704DDAE|nr:DUF4767 domain-containing protein [Pediococcus damnosus]PIO82033.1 DUF4767 domain-containing protein [Pediococcus damnosus]PJE50308.1 DUF4767 domain-containing protein [Pediococcus damnosus]